MKSKQGRPENKNEMDANVIHLMSFTLNDMLIKYNQQTYSSNF